MAAGKGRHKDMIDFLLVSDCARSWAQTISNIPFTTVIFAATWLVPLLLPLLVEAVAVTSDYITLQL